jgi:hypothetical protein
MNLKEPNTCRVLAILIQDVVFEDREQFINDAENAPDMKTFMEGMTRYKTIK